MAAISEKEWWTSHDNVLALARWLHDRGEFDDISAVLYYFESPWKMDGEWEHYQQHPDWGYADGEEARVPSPYGFRPTNVQKPTCATCMEQLGKTAPAAQE